MIALESFLPVEPLHESPLVADTLQLVERSDVHVTVVDCPEDTRVGCVCIVRLELPIIGGLVTVQLG